MFKTFPAPLIILKLVETGAGGGEQYGIARSRMLVRIGHRALDRVAIGQDDGASERFSDQRRGHADKQDAFRALSEGRSQQGVIAVFVLAPQNDPQTAGK